MKPSQKIRRWSIYLGFLPAFICVLLASGKFPEVCVIFGNCAVEWSAVSNNMMFTLASVFFIGVGLVVLLLSAMASSSEKKESN